MPPLLDIRSPLLGEFRKQHADVLLLGLAELPPCRHDLLQALGSTDQYSVGRSGRNPVDRLFFSRVGAQVNGGQQRQAEEAPTA
ncbi:hypothetical protein [Bradyrhizobium brasilense]|uniref:Uncharacterized protein n=1 Tax=Bradyrhizobium brasilense TaxID=1419277 RepID=A0ABY8JFA5_9BRAD|nr:hypothetical protein [Bradyrhizobium brasilense]WFU62638.1 hypothetical protein QA636_35130 [Bradyrhizobium brasilense]